MTESTIYTHNKVYSCLTSYLIAAGTTEVVLDLSAAHRASKVCVLHGYNVCMRRLTNLSTPNMEVITCLRKRTPPKKPQPCFAPSFVTAVRLSVQCS